MTFSTSQRCLCMNVCNVPWFLSKPRSKCLSLFLSSSISRSNLKAKSDTKAVHSWEETRKKSCGFKPLTSDFNAVSQVWVSAVFAGTGFSLGSYFFPASTSRGDFATCKILWSPSLVWALLQTATLDVPDCENAIVVPSMPGTGSVSQPRSALLCAQKLG